MRKPRAHRYFGASAALALAALGHSLAPLPDCSAATPTLFSCDVLLSPTCIDGQFPVSIQTSTGKVLATLKVDTNVRGRLTGRLEVGALSLNVTGAVSHAGSATHVSFKATTSGARLTFVGDVADGATTLAGNAVGKGFIAAGTNPFTMDVSSALPQIATVECALTINKKGVYSGKGHVLACGDEVALKVSGRSKKGAISLALKNSRWFKFAGTGPAGGADLVLDWTARGFGGSGSGTALLLYPVTPPETLTYPAVSGLFDTDAPIDAIVPLTGDAPRGKFTVSPSLPVGIVIDPADGRISGTPTEVASNRTYTVTAANYAGTTSATLSFGTRIPRARSFAAETRFLTDADYRHFLGRAEFGLRQLGGGQTNLDRVKSTGLDAYIDSMLVFSQNGPAEAIAAPELVNGNDPPALKGKFPSADQLARWWTSLIVNSDNPFQERLALFWANRFAAASDSLDFSQSHLMQDYVNLYRYEGNGNLRSLILKMSRSGVMIKYLNGDQNTAANPNENFAREVWELFTLGVDNGYTQADIMQGAKAWTGYKFVTNQATSLASVVFDPNLHDAGQKTVLGQVVAAQSAGDDYKTMVDLTIDHAQVAEFLTAKLFESFAFEKPDPRLVADMAANLRAANYELAPFLKALFKSEAFFSNAARGAIAKSPIDYAVGFIHATGMKPTTAVLESNLVTLRQAPTLPPSVKGFPVGNLWFSEQQMADRANLLEALIGVGVNNAILPPVGQRSSGQVVDSVGTLFGLTLLPEERQLCIDYMNKPVVFTGATQAQINDKVGGLLAILAQHPFYEVR